MLYLVKSHIHPLQHSSLDNDDEQISGYIEMRFTAYYQPPAVRMPIDDYLGMDCWFYYNPETETSEFDCFNTDAI